MKKRSVRYQVGGVVVLLILVFFLPAVAMSVEEDVASGAGADVFLDVQYIYDITEALSNIVFDSYNESAGDIAKGRVFGSVGERHAAEILAENLSALGLNTTVEQLTPRPGVSDDFLTKKLEVTAFDASLDGKELDCYIAPSWRSFRADEEMLDWSCSYEDVDTLPIPKNPLVFHPRYAMRDEPFVFVTRDQWNDPDGVMPVLDLVKPFVDPLKFYMAFHMTSLFQIGLWTAAWSKMYSNCVGVVLYDFNENCHDMVYLPERGNMLPVLFVTNTAGVEMLEKSDTGVLDFSLSQRYNQSVISYNVIGTIPGSDPSKTVILSCLYDSWWCQGTADSAIGMGIVLGVAKYFVEAGITPEYSVKFIGFSGEEYDLRGARHYEAVHADEEVVAVIDLNQLGFTQNTPRLTLDFVSNKKRFLDQVDMVVSQSNYQTRTGNVTDVKMIWWPVRYIPGNSGAFALERPACPVLSVFKDGGWMLHHRDGLNHTEGDVLKYFNWTDSEVTAEIILNLTRYFSKDSSWNLEQETLITRSRIALEQRFV